MPNQNTGKIVCKNGHVFTYSTTYVNPDGHRTCKVCRYQSIKKFKSKNPKYYSDLQKKTNRDKKIELIAYKGDVCVDCKLKFHPCVYHFDHRDPFSKSFTLGDRKNRPMDELKKEADKCDLVCANCHALRTYGSEEISKKVKLAKAAKGRA